MAKITNFDTLRRLHDWARVAKVGSREWIEFATTMMDSFPELYDTAKGMNAEFSRMRRDAERYRYLTADADMGQGDVLFGLLHGRPIDGPSVDDEIDAAMTTN